MDNPVCSATWLSRLMVWVSNLNEQSLTPRFSSDFFWISCLVSAMLFSLTLKVFFYIVGEVAGLQARPSGTTLPCLSANQSQ